MRWAVERNLSAWIQTALDSTDENTRIDHTADKNVRVRRTILTHDGVFRVDVDDEATPSFGVVVHTPYSTTVDTACEAIMLAAVHDCSSPTKSQQLACDAHAALRGDYELPAIEYNGNHMLNFCEIGPLHPAHDALVAWLDVQIKHQH